MTGEVEPFPSRCPFCGYDLTGVKPDIVFCPECGKHVRARRPFSRDGWVHFGWILTLAALPLLVIVAQVSGATQLADVFRSVVRRIPGVLMVVAFLIHLVVVPALAELGSAHHRRSRPVVAFLLAIPLGLVALYVCRLVATL